MILTPEHARIIPAELRALPQWVNFSVQTDPATGRAVKRPIISGGSQPASPTNPATWRPFEEAVKYPHPAFAFTAEDPFVFLDLDDIIRLPADTDASWAARQATKQGTHSWLLQTFGDSYVEESVSGRGKHIIGRGTVGKGWQVPGLGVYDRDRFCIFTGKGAGGIVDFDPSELDKMTRELRKTTAGEEIVEMPVIPESERRDDATIIEEIVSFDRGRTLWEGRWQELVHEKQPGQDMSQSAFDHELALMIFELAGDSQQTHRIFSQSGLYRSKATPAYIERSIHTGVTRMAQEEEFVRKTLENLNGHSKPRKSLLPEEKKEKIPTMNELLRDMPEGLMKDMAKEIQAMAMYPIAGVSMLTSMAMSAMLYQRWHEGPDRKGLNLYMLLLARSSAGKAPFTTMVSNLLGEVGEGALNRLWRGELRSEQAVAEALTECPRIVMVKTEADAWITSMSSANASTWERNASSVFTSLWSLSSGVYAPTRRAKMQAAELQIVQRPCMSVLAETQPESLWPNLSSHGMDKGIFPRFVVVQVSPDEIPVHKNVTRKDEFSQALISRVKTVVRAGDEAHRDNEVKAITHSPASEKMFDTFCIKCREKLLAPEMEDAAPAIYGKIAENTLKLASLVTASQGKTVISEEAMSWSIKFMTNSARSVEKALAETPLSDGSMSDVFGAILRHIETIRDIPAEERMTKYRNIWPDRRLAEQANLVPLSMLRKKIARTKVFRYGGADDLYKILETMKREGYIEGILPREDTKKNFGVGVACVVPILPQNSAEESVGEREA